MLHDGETVSVLSTDNLEFMSSSVELKTEPDHYSKVEKVKYSKGKHAAGKDDTTKTENSLTPDSPDAIGELPYFFYSFPSG